MVCLASAAIGVLEAKLCRWHIRHDGLNILGKCHECSSRRFLHCGANMTAALEMQSILKAKADKIRYELAWYDDREFTFICKQGCSLWNEPVERQAFIVASQSASYIIRQGVLGEEWRIAENGIKRCICGREVCVPEVAKDASDAAVEGTFGNVLLGLQNSFRVDVDAQHFCFRVPLCSHQGNEPCSYADIEDLFALDRAPSPEQNTICTNFHGTAVVVDAELLKAENVIGHFLMKD